MGVGFARMPAQEPFQRPRVAFLSGFAPNERQVPFVFLLPEADGLGFVVVYGLDG